MNLGPSRGFTLIELMIVIAIIGILASIAYPNYQRYLEGVRRGGAKSVLIQFASAMERYYTQNNSYRGITGEISTTLTSPPVSLFPSEAPLEGNNKFYDLYIYDLKANSFILRAVPKNAQSGDGFLQLRSNGVREWDRDNSASIDPNEDTWSR